MKISLLTIFLFAVLNANGQSSAYKKILESYYDPAFPTLTITEAYQKLKEKEVVFVDVRTREEFNVSHIEGSLRMDPDSKDLSALKAIPKDKTIIVYCSVGARSQSLGQHLKKAGYDAVYNLYGGLFHWFNRKYPVVDSMGERTETIHGYDPSWGKWVSRGKVVY